MDFWLQVQVITDGCNPHQEPGSIGYDMFAAQDGIIDPLQRSKPIPLGFKTAFTPGWAGLLLDRSSMGNKGITHFAGVADPNYRDEWRAILYNSTHDTFRYKKGDKLIQCVFTIAGVAKPQIMDSLPESNRKGGFGTTDKLATVLEMIGYSELIPHLFRFHQDRLLAWAEEVWKIKQTAAVNLPLPTIPEDAAGFVTGRK